MGKVAVVIAFNTQVYIRVGYIVILSKLKIIVKSGCASCFV